jgi:hypothetical protein
MIPAERILEHRAYTNAELNADAQPLPFDEWLEAIERIEARQVTGGD